MLTTLYPLNVVNLRTFKIKCRSILCKILLRAFDSGKLSDILKTYKTLNAKTSLGNNESPMFLNFTLK